MPPKTIPRALGALLSLSILLFCVLTAFINPAFDIKFYEREFDKLNVYETVNVHKDDVMRVTAHMINYFQNKNDDLQIDVAIGYKISPSFSSARDLFFSDRAIEHMKDVKYLVRLARLVSLAAAAATLLILIYAIFNRAAARLMRRAMLWGAGAVVVAGGIIAALVAVNFEAGFTKFHEMFFTNDLWLLDWDDRLLNIVPTEFFTDLAIKGGVTALIYAALGLGFFYATLRVVCAISQGEKR